MKVSKGRDIMNTKKYYLGTAIIIAALCTAVFGEIEQTTQDTLLDRPNPALARIRQLYIVILADDGEPNKDGLSLKKLEESVEKKIGENGIKIAEAIGRENTLRSLAIPELRIDITTLKLEESQQYMFHIQTSLAKKVYLTKNSSRRIKADVWKTEPTMQAVSVQHMPIVVTAAVMEQVEAFIHAYLAANSSGRRTSEASGISTAAKEQTEPVEQSSPAEYQYFASKNSRVFHRPDCSWVKRIKPENLVGYVSREEAINSGKRPCKRCNP